MKKKENVLNYRNRGKTNTMSLYLLMGVFLALMSGTVIAYEDFGEIQDAGMRSSMQAMRCFEVHWTNYTFYTMNVDTPGYVETGVYNTRVKYDEDDYRIETKPFIRWRAGPVVRTGDPFDIYIDADSKGLMVIKLPFTTGYTRDGRLGIDSNRRLVTRAGNYPVLGEGGEIYLPEGRDFDLSKSGLIFVDGEPVDRIKIAVFKNMGEMSTMETLNGSVFVLTEEVELLEGPSHYAVRQGYLEQNNVIKALIGDITFSTNAYISNARVGKSIARIMGSAIQLANPSQ
mgnify:CR=1 FL=1